MSDPENLQTTKEVTEEVTPETELKPAEQSQPTPPPPASQPEETVESLKEKLSASARENQLLRLADQQRVKAEQELTKEPTDSDLRAAFPSWDLYDDTQEEFARTTFAAQRTSANAIKIATELRNDKELSTSIELVVSSNPALQGREQAFRQYASQPKYRNIPMDVLVPAFLGAAPAAPAPTTTLKPGLLPGNGGPRIPEKPKQLSAGDLALLRTTDEKAYTEYVKTHDINPDELD